MAAMEEIQNFTDQVPIPAQPLNSFGNKSLVKQIEDSLNDQINVSDSNRPFSLSISQYRILVVNKLLFCDQEYTWELEKLERAEDGEQRLAMIVYDDNEVRSLNST